MWSANNGASPLADIRSLLLVYAGWKSLLFIGIAFSPGPGYDTSTQILLPSVSASDPLPIRVISHVLTRLVRWDALYFVKVANRGYLYEQEWAWGSGFTTLVGDVAKGAQPLDTHTSRLATRLSISSIFCCFITATVCRGHCWHLDLSHLSFAVGLVPLLSGLADCP